MISIAKIDYWKFIFQNVATFFRHFLRKSPKFDGDSKNGLGLETLKNIIKK